jgi:hypothetical protein
MLGTGDVFPLLSSVAPPKAEFGDWQASGIEDWGLGWQKSQWDLRVIRIIEWSG